MHIEAIGNTREDWSYSWKGTDHEEEYPGNHYCLSDHTVWFSYKQHGLIISLFERLLLSYCFWQAGADSRVCGCVLKLPWFKAVKVPLKQWEIQPWSLLIPLTLMMSSVQQPLSGKTNCDSFTNLDSPPTGWCISITNSYMILWFSRDGWGSETRQLMKRSR